MIVLPQYDEFGIYITIDDIKSFVSSLFEKGVSSEEEIFSNCLSEFGRDCSHLIEKVLYGED
jgi:hypothetical protein